MDRGWADGLVGCFLGFSLRIRLHCPLPRSQRRPPPSSSPPAAPKPPNRPAMSQIPVHCRRCRSPSRWFKHPLFQHIPSPSPPCQTRSLPPWDVVSSVFQVFFFFLPRPNPNQHHHHQDGLPETRTPPLSFLLTAYPNLATRPLSPSQQQSLALLSVARVATSVSASESSKSCHEKKPVHVSWSRLSFRLAVATEQAIYAAPSEAHRVFGRGRQTDLWAFFHFLSPPKCESWPCHQPASGWHEPVCAVRRLAICGR
ncbi:hypothetical protein B0T10DRAFT_245709 [Thelonectria olida]|uniref:Uncharacterized protein n=1 Tax=Thelonectria olida TaxID=1576542 RepID=A0A9P9ASU1_9HYPO|nr:hypothetical protein B0T10DRAFT_245709 [Thelonectria olida]